MERKTYDWVCGSRTIRLGEKSRVMGILNVTTDSFSDGEHFVDPEDAVKRALQMVEEVAVTMTSAANPHVPVLRRFRL